MARKCENCNILEKYKYWNELTPTKHQFFKIMSGDYDQQLFVPPKFAECFKGQLSSKVLLKGPSGIEWRINFSRPENGCLVFSEGWQGFVADNYIRPGDYLVFQFVGCSTFEVNIFNATGCEREESHFAKSGSTSQTICNSMLHVKQEVNENSEDENCVIVSDDLFEEDTRGSVGEKRAHNVDEFDSISEDSNEEEMEDDSWDNLPSSEESNKNCFSGSSRGRKRNSQRVKIPQMYYKSNRRAVHEKEKQNAVKKAATHQPTKKCPFVSIVLKRTHVYRGFNMTIPKRWAAQHMFRGVHEVELHVPAMDESWLVGCRWTSSDQCQLRANWPKFVLDNNLEEHDVCVFELVQKAKPGEMNNNTSILDVYIYRVVDDVVPLTVSKRMA